MSQIQYEMKSKIGSVFLVASENGLQGILWRKKNTPLTQSLTGTNTEIKIIAKAVGQLEEYFDGSRTEFDLPLDVSGTDFQFRVWNELSKIPYGETCSYKDIAVRLKNEKAVRAVGTANGKNPISIMVPCHRVIGSNGTLTGYAGGLAIKTKLLEIEKVERR